MTDVVAAPSVEARWVDSAPGLDEVVAELAGAPTYAVDTEFHRERSYFPQVALVQLAWPTAGGGNGGGQAIALVDPLAVDLAPFRAVLEGPGLAVMHAASQDLEVLQRATGATPSRLFDTQLVAGFLGFATPSLTVLADRVLGVHLPKGNRLTDWLQRPLGDDQRTYAAADVEHLLRLADLLRAELVAAERLAWAEEECQELLHRSWGPSDPDAAWLRIKEGRQLRGKARGIAQAVGAWRERKAAETDQPVRFVLPDLAVVGIANNPPSTKEQLRKVRGLEERHARGRVVDELLGAVEVGRSLAEDELRTSKREEVERDARPAVALVSAWLAQVGRDLRIDAGLLATRADLGAFLADGDVDNRLTLGWRAGLLGEPIRRLVGGDFALAFDGHGGLALECRSGEPAVGPFTADSPLFTWD